MLFEGGGLKSCNVQEDEGHYIASLLSRCLNNSHHALQEFLKLCRDLSLNQSAFKSYSAAENQSLVFATHRDASSEGKLILAGLHGDEPAGVLGILLFLRRIAHAGNLHKYPPFAVLPLISPTAFNLNRRTNAWNENANRGYFPASTKGNEEAENPSREGRTILENFESIVTRSAAGTISLHEDVDCSEFYLYAYENNDRPTEAATIVRDIGKDRFGTVKCDPNFPEGAVLEGIIHNDIGSGALDEALFLAGSKVVIVSETPGKRPLAERVEANAELLATFLSDK